MFRLFKRRAGNASAINAAPLAKEIGDAFGKALVAKSGKDLLSKHSAIIENIYSFCQLDRKRFEASYLALFENVAALVQDLPASERHHHAHLGGLLEHSLEVAAYCARISGRFLYTDDGEEQILARSALYVFSMVSAGVLHDIGKALVDIDVVTIEGGKPVLWDPTMGLLKPGARYIYQYNKRRLHGLHETAGILMVVSLMPPKAFQWIWEAANIRNQWLAAIGGKAMELGGRIGECLIECDSASTGEAMATAPAALAAQAESMVTGEKPRLDALLIKGIVKSFTSFEPNTQNNPYWVSQKFIACVAPRFIEVAKAALGAAGQHLPDKDSSSVLYDILMDNGALIPNPLKKAVHNLSFSERAKPLSVVLFRREVLDPDLSLPCHQGKLICPSCPEELCHADGQKHPLGTSTTSTTASMQAPEKTPAPTKNPTKTPARQSESAQARNSTPSSQPRPAAPVPAQDKQPVQAPSAQSSAAQNQSVNTFPAIQANHPAPNREATAASQMQTIAPPAVLEAEIEADQNNVAYGVPTEFSARDFKNYLLANEASDQANQQVALSVRKQLNNEFVSWLRFEVLSGAIKVNDLGSPVHVVEGRTIALVTPEIFLRFIKSGRAGNEIPNKKHAVSRVQHAVLQHMTFKKSFVGSNMINCSVSGMKNSNRLHVMVTTQETTEQLGLNIEEVMPNKHISIQEMFM